MLEQNSHRTDANHNSPNYRLRAMSRSKNKTIQEIMCESDSCFDEPTARCHICSKYYCYKHVQLCLQIHPTEIEIMVPRKNIINTPSLSK